MLLFTENETNAAQLFDATNAQPYVKDAFHDYVVHGRTDAVNPGGQRDEGGGALSRSTFPRGARSTLRLRLSMPRAKRRRSRSARSSIRSSPSGFARRTSSTRTAFPGRTRRRGAQVARQAYAGLLWTKQFYHYVVSDWLDGDPEQPPPPAARKHGRNARLAASLSTATSSRCRTSGNIRGTPRGIWRFT